MTRAAPARSYASRGSGAALLLLASHLAKVEWMRAKHRNLFAKSVRVVLRKAALQRASLSIPISHELDHAYLLNRSHQPHHGIKCTVEKHPAE